MRALVLVSLKTRLQCDETHIRMRIIEAEEASEVDKYKKFVDSLAKSGLKLSNSKHNRILRICAALMASLYMALSTFGSLTHLHEVSSPRTESAVTTHGAQQRLISAQHLGSGKCAYCDWMANNLSPAVAVQMPTEFCADITPATSWRPSAFASRIERSSSRAPPHSAQL